MTARGFVQLIQQNIFHFSLKKTFERKQRKTKMNYEHKTKHKFVLNAKIRNPMS